MIDHLFGLLHWEILKVVMLSMEDAQVLWDFVFELKI